MYAPCCLSNNQWFIDLESYRTVTQDPLTDNEVPLAPQPETYESMLDQFVDLDCFEPTPLLSLEQKVEQRFKHQYSTDLNPLFINFNVFLTAFGDPELASKTSLHMIHNDSVPFFHKSRLLFNYISTMYLAGKKEAAEAYIHQNASLIEAVITKSLRYMADYVLQQTPDPFMYPSAHIVDLECQFLESPTLENFDALRKRAHPNLPADYLRLIGFCYFFDLILRNKPENIFVVEDILQEFVSRYPNAPGKEQFEFLIAQYKLEHDLLDDPWKANLENKAWALLKKFPHHKIAAIRMLSRQSLAWDLESLKEEVLTLLKKFKKEYATSHDFATSFILYDLAVLGMSAPQKMEEALENALSIFSMLRDSKATELAQNSFFYENLIYLILGDEEKFKANIQHTRSIQDVLTVVGLLLRTQQIDKINRAKRLASDALNGKFTGLQLSEKDKWLLLKKIGDCFMAEHDYDTAKDYYLRAKQHYSDLALLDALIEVSVFQNKPGEQKDYLIEFLNKKPLDLKKRFDLIHLYLEEYALLYEGSNTLLYDIVDPILYHLEFINNRHKSIPNIQSVIELVKTATEKGFLDKSQLKTIKQWLYRPSKAVDLNPPNAYYPAYPHFRPILYPLPHFSLQTSLQRAGLNPTQMTYPTISHKQPPPLSLSTIKGPLLSLAMGVLRKLKKR